MNSMIIPEGGARRRGRNRRGQTAEERAERRMAEHSARAAAAPPPCAEIRETLQDLRLRELLCLGEKITAGSDLKSDLGRLFIPRDSSNMLKPRLSEAERMAVEAAGLGVTVVDWTGGKWDLRYQYWSSVNMHVINNGWNDFVKDRDLQVKVGDKLRFWAFRTGFGDLGFAIQRV